MPSQAIHPPFPASLKNTFDVAEWALDTYRRIALDPSPSPDFNGWAASGERCACYELLVGILGIPESSRPEEIIEIFADRIRDGRRDQRIGC